MKSLIFVLLLWACCSRAQENKEQFLDAPKGLGNSTATEKLISSKNETVANNSAKSNATLPENATLSVKNDDSGNKNISAEDSDKNIDEKLNDEGTSDSHHEAKKNISMEVNGARQQESPSLKEALQKEAVKRPLNAQEEQMLKSFTGIGNATEKDGMNDVIMENTKTDTNVNERINVVANATENATENATAKATSTDNAAENINLSAPDEKMIANEVKAKNSTNVLIKRDMMGGGGGGGGGGGHEGCMEGPCIDAEPGYYSQECHAQKKCNDPKKFCHMYTCTDCLKDNIVCTNNGQCCDGSICIYGRCAGGSKGSKVPGKFCDRQDDCASDACCVHEHQINPIIKICKPKLSKHQTCGPHNQFHQSDEHGAVDAACEPCKGKLQCKQVGLFGVHEICLDP